MKEGFATFFQNFFVEKRKFGKSCNNNKVIPAWKSWEEFNAVFRAPLWRHDASPRAHALSHDVNVSRIQYYITILDVCRNI